MNVLNLFFFCPQIFLQTRPYDLLMHKTTYNVGQKVNSNSLIQNIPDKVALILMNATFPQVKYFPKIFNLNPITEKEPLECITVGFSLLGRNIKLPIVGRVKPVAFKFSAHFSVTECVAKWVYTQKNKLIKILVENQQYYGIGLKTERLGYLLIIFRFTARVILLIRPRIIAIIIPDNMLIKYLYISA